MTSGQSSPEIRRWADRLLGAQAAAALIPTITDTEPHFDLDAAYAVQQEIARARHGYGWKPVGRKIGFTNTTIWQRYGVEAPMWAHVWDRTVRDAVRGTETVEVSTFAQPRIEPEVVVGLADQISPSMDVEDVLRSVAWVAAGFEVVDCHFADWRFTLADCTADFGLHGQLIVGQPVDARDIENSADLEQFLVTLRRDDEAVDQGRGTNVLGGPLRALLHLALVLEEQGNEPLQAGEIITTGTVTDAWPLLPDRTWTADYGDLRLPSIQLKSRSTAKGSSGYG